MGFWKSLGNTATLGLFGEDGGPLGRAVSGPKKYDINELAFKDPNYQANQNKIGGFLNRYSTTGVDQLAPGQTDQFRTGQTSLVSQLQGRVAGTAPSLAQQQLQSGQESNIKSLMAQAGSSPSTSAGLLSRNLARGISDSNMNTNAQMAELRAGEQIGAEQTLAGVLSGARGQDIGVQQQRDQMVQQYLAMGLSLDQANFQAQMDLEALKAGAYEKFQEARTKNDTGLLSAIAGGASAAMTGK